MKRILAALFLVAPAGCAGGPEEPPAPPPTPWEYRPPHGFVNRETLETLSPAELYARAHELHQRQEHEEAALLLGILADQGPDPALRGKALYLRGLTLMKAGVFVEAYRSFDFYLTLFPEGDYSLQARKAMMECGLGLARVGQADSFLGLVRTSAAGLELLKNTLQRFPREDFSDDYYLKLAEFYHRRGRLAEAELELKFILSEPGYRNTNAAPRALLLLGKIGLERYDGVHYDHKALADAKRAFEQFELDHKRLLDDPRARKELGLEDLPALLDTARAGIAFVNERFAEREYTLAEFYLDRGRPQAAALYLHAILKNYPQTSWSRRAEHRLKDLAPETP